jgi:hypothetical protein
MRSELEDDVRRVECPGSDKDCSGVLPSESREFNTRILFPLLAMVGRFVTSPLHVHVWAESVG